MGRSREYLLQAALYENGKRARLCITEHAKEPDQGFNLKPDKTIADIDSSLFMILMNSKKVFPIHLKNRW